MKRQRPESVPALTLNDLPGYVTSSEEDAGGDDEGDNDEEQEKNSQE